MMVIDFSVRLLDRVSGWYLGLGVLGLQGPCLSVSDYPRLVRLGGSIVLGVYVYVVNDVRLV